MTNEEILFDEIEKLNKKLVEDKEALLEGYKAKTLKYPIGFTFPYKGELAKVNGFFADLVEPDYFHQFEYEIYAGYICYLPSFCDNEIALPNGGKGVIGDVHNAGIRVLQVEIDRILEQANG